MRSIIITALLLIVFAFFAAADGDHIIPIRPAYTYSIVCYDSTTGQFGAAVQSHWFKGG